MSNMSNFETPLGVFTVVDKKAREDVERVNTSLTDIKMLGWSVPKDCPIQNSVSGSTFTQNVGRVDLGKLNWTYNSSNKVFLTTIDGTKTITSSNEKMNGICSKYPVESPSSTVSPKLSKFANNVLNGQVYVYDPSYTDVSTFLNAIKGEYFYFELATPITYTIDGNEAVTQLNESLEEQGLLEKYDGIMTQGQINTANGQPASNTNAIYSNIYSCKENDKVVIEYGSTLKEMNVVFFNNGTWQSGKNTYSLTNKISFTVPSGCNQFRFDIRQNSAFTPSSASKISVRINNAIDTLKADLIKIQNKSLSAQTVEANKMFSVEIDVPVLSGYKPIGVVGYSLSRNANIIYDGVRILNGKIVIDGVSTVDATLFGNVDVMYVMQ